jgi:hypothetical protein
MEQMIRSVSPNPLAIFVMQRGSIWYMWFANHDFSISCFFFLGTRVQTNALPKKHPRRRPQNAMGQIVGCTAKWWPEAVEHQVIFSSWPNKIRKPPHSWITKEGPILATSLSSLGPARFSGEELRMTDEFWKASAGCDELLVCGSWRFHGRHVIQEAFSWSRKGLSLHKLDQSHLTSIGGSEWRYFHGYPTKCPQLPA